jgi:hypothetical protein
MLFFPLMVVAVLVFLGVLALVGIPYFMLYPDHHMHAYDEGTERQQAIMLRYRRFTSRVPFWRRVGRVLAFPFRRKQPRPVRARRNAC